MKLNKNLVKKKNKKNKKRQKKIIKNNVDVVSEKISFLLDKADPKLIKNITTILTPKIALRICNETTDVEDSGGINDPKLLTRRLSKLECFLYLIENDSTISENKKDQALNRTTSSATPTTTPKANKRKRKQLKLKVKGIQNELDKLCLNQVKNEANNLAGNYFAVQSLNKLNDQPSSNCFASNSGCLKPSTFNLNMNSGALNVTPNYCTDLLSRPKLDLNQLNYNSNSANDSVLSNLKMASTFNNSVQNVPNLQRSLQPEQVPNVRNEFSFNFRSGAQNNHPNMNHSPDNNRPSFQVHIVFPAPINITNNNLQVNNIQNTIIQQNNNLDVQNSFQTTNSSNGNHAVKPSERSVANLFG